MLLLRKEQKDEMKGTRTAAGGAHSLFHKVLQLRLHRLLRGVDHFLQGDRGAGEKHVITGGC